MTSAAPTEHDSTFPARFHELFGSNELWHGTYKPEPTPIAPGVKVEIRSTAKTLPGAPNPELWRQHLAGEQPLGVIPIREDDTCTWAVIDVDELDFDHAAIAARLRRDGLPLVVCRSKSGGGHLFLFLSEPIAASVIRRRMREIATALGYPPETEVFPKHDTATSPEHKHSAWLNMAYFQGDETNRYGVKENGLAMSVDEFLDVAEAARLTLAQLEGLKASTPSKADRKKQDGDSKAPTPAEFEKLLDGWLRILAEATPGKADNTLTAVARDVGRWASVIDMNLTTIEQRAREAWRQRGKPDAEFDAQWERNVRWGQRRGDPPRLSEAAATPLIRLLADVPMEPIEWLWPGRFAVGKISMLAGHPGLGKSQLTMYMAAQVSRGRPWPFGEGKAPLGRVLVLSAEDDVADTLRPRFEAAGGNSSMVEVLDGVRTDKGERGLNLADDVRLLDRVLSCRDDYRLVIIDPISAYLGKTDTHTASEVRNVLAPIQKLAEQHRVAVVCVSHLVKAAGTAAINAVNGSGAFVAAARIACIVTKEMRDEEDEQGRTVKVETGRRIISIAKNNLGPDGSDRSLAYSVDSRNLGDGLEAPLIVWDEPVNMSADEAVGFREPGQPTKANDKGMRFLRRMLRDGPALSVDVEKAAEAEGISLSTLKRAKKELGAVSEKQADRWVMYIPGRQAELPL
ncbi:hypothetical protein ELH26_09135 [Rhizobium leguminosarum]|uniref:AAA family ATPase n=1 Tax=Rhizobium leguminosarum TaxID=384 RepID=UPI00102F6420|nr:AAA family ATPase [Rhizobium leguminosarum]TBC94165.1 hypothetical protein ELH26_09135 [Rhizobium leguminosarum]